MAWLNPPYRDGERLEIGGAQVRLSVSRRARRVSLRIDRARREVVAVAPSLRRLAEAAAFARQRRAWVAERLAELPAPRLLEAGETLVLFGAPFPLAEVGAIKREALAVFEARARAHCAALGVDAPRIAVTDARTRWGSCSPARPGRAAAIRLSWRLALAPRAVADYVVAHECAHLLEANHGPGFWRLVRTLVGDEKPPRAWLRAHGAALHAVDPPALRG